MKTKHTSIKMTGRVFIVLFLSLLTNQFLVAQDWLTGWTYRKLITVTNNEGSELVGYQSRVSLDGSFPWGHVKSDGSDIRFTMSDGTSDIAFWIESWTYNSSATIWVKIPSIPVSGTAVYLYYDNSSATSAANGNTTFEFFDDFETSTTTYGYYTLSEFPSTPLVKDQTWEETAPLTMDFIDWETEVDGFQYWGYYGLVNQAGDGIGLARSNDLVTWTKYVSNPVVPVDDGRCPTVLLVNDTIHLFYTDYTNGNSNIVSLQSTNGIEFRDTIIVVPSELGYFNRNPDLFVDPVGGNYYLYWARVPATNDWFQIMARTASTIDGLSTADNILIFESHFNMLAPDMMYNDGKYFLTCEVSPLLTPLNWETYGWISTTSPLSGFIPLQGNPILGNGTAVFSQHVVGNTLHTFDARWNGSEYVMEYRSADLTEQLQEYRVPDSTKWAAFGGTWKIETQAQKSGSAGGVVHADNVLYQFLRSSFTGNDYIVEAEGKQIFERAWGLGFRMADNLNYFSSLLYNTSPTNDKVIMYNVTSTGTPVTVAEPSVGKDIQIGPWYKMTVKAHGSYFDVYIDDVRIINNVSNSSHPTGSIALYTGRDSEAYFNDLRVRKYAGSEPTLVIGEEQDIGNQLNISATETNVLCYGGSDGSIDLNVEGGTAPYTYSWAHGPTTEDVTGLSAGTYSVFVKDESEPIKTGSKSFTITQPDALVPAYTITRPVNCDDEATVQITASGGISPYSGTGNFQQLVNTTVPYTIYDDNGCNAYIEVTIDPNATPETWLEGWKYCNPIYISNPGGSTLTDFQVKITLDDTYDFSKAKTGGDDIIFTQADGTTLLDYWIENWDITNKLATMWVKVPSIPGSGDTVIYMYYGNTTATEASDGENTFEFFDDFETSSQTPDPTKWTALGDGGYTWNIVTTSQQNGISGKVVQGITTANRLLQTLYFSGTDYILEAYGKQVSVVGWGLGFRCYDPTNSFTANLYENLDEYDNLYIYNWGGTAPLKVISAGIGVIDLNIWYKMTVKAHGSNFDVYIDDIPGINNATNSSHPEGGVGLFGENGTNAYFNDVRVRKYAAIDPSASIGGVLYKGIQWTGNDDTDWDNGKNWWTCSVPSAANDIAIFESDNVPVISGAVTCNNLIIEPSASLTIDVSGSLSATGSITINSSSTYSSGSLINYGTDNITGTVTYNRFLRPEANSGDRHFFSSPVSGQDIGDFITANSSKIVQDGSVYNIWEWDELTGDWPIVNSGDFVDGKGYNVDQAAGSDGLLTFTGSVINNTTYTATSPYAWGYTDRSDTAAYHINADWSGDRSWENYGGGGWNLMGNPFTSSMDAAAFIEENSEKFDPHYQALYVYDGINNIYQYAAASPPGWPESGGFGSTVQAGQGFFVLALYDGIVFNFDATMQEHNTGVVLKSARVERPWPGLQLKISYGEKERMTTIIYNSEMTAGNDPGYDVGLLSTYPDVEIYTTMVLRCNDVHFARQALPLSRADTIIIPIGIDSYKGGEVTFSAYTVPIKNYKFWLEDRKTGIFTNLNSNTYKVILPEKTYGTDRFFVHTSVNKPVIKPSKKDHNLPKVRIWGSHNQVHIEGIVSNKAICAVYDIMGRRIFETHLTDSDHNTFMVPETRKGIYLVRVIDGTKIYTEKVVIH